MPDSGKAQLEFTGQAAQFLGEAAKVLQTFKSMQEAMNKNNEIAEKHTKTTKDLGGAMDELGEKAVGATKMLIGIGGVAEILEKVKEVAQAAGERIDKLGEKSDRLGQNLKKVALVAGSPEEAKGLSERSKTLTDQYHLKEGEGEDFVASSKQIAKSDAEAAKMAEQMARLRQLGVGQAESKEAIRGGMQAGLSPEQSANEAIKLGRESGMDIGKAMDLSQHYSSPQQGLGVMSELRRIGGYRSEKQAYGEAEAAYEGLDQDPKGKGEKGKFGRFLAQQAKLRGKDVSSMSETDKMDLLAESMPDTSAAALEKKGLDDKQAKVISKLIAHRDEVRQLSQPAAPDTADKAKETMEGVPEIKHLETKEAADSASQHAEQSGTFAAVERDRDAQRKAEDLHFKRTNMLEEQDGYGGEMRAAIRRVIALGTDDHIRMPGVRGTERTLMDEEYSDRGIAQPQSGEENLQIQTKLMEELSKNTKAVEENTRVTQAANGGTPPATPAASSSSGYISPSAGNGN